MPIAKGAKTLREELEARKGESVLIGMRSSFFFVGPAEEALKDMKFIGVMSRVCVPLMSQGRVTKRSLGSEDVGARNVIKTYGRNAAGKDETVIIVEGGEFGAFWTREEYLRGKAALREALKKWDFVA